MDALKPFNSKYVTLTMRGGFFTKFAILAHGAMPLSLKNLSLKVFKILFFMILLSPKSDDVIYGWYLGRNGLFSKLE